MVNWQFKQATLVALLLLVPGQRLFACDLDLLKPHDSPAVAVAAAPAWPLDHPIPAEKTLEWCRYEGMTAKIVEFASGNLSGQQNLGIYRQEAGDSAQLVKILSHDLMYYERNRPWIGDHYADQGNQSQQYDLNRRYQGMLLGQRRGGPRIVKIGVFAFENGWTRPFVVMNEFFHGRQTVTLKGKILAANGSRQPDMLNFLTDGGDNRLTDRMAAKIIEALEDGIYPADIDFLISGDDFVWIDTETWAPYKGIDSFRFGLGVPNTLGMLFRSNPSVAHRFLADFVARLDKSVIITAEEKEALKAQILKSMHE